MWDPTPRLFASWERSREILGFTAFFFLGPADPDRLEITLFFDRDWRELPLSFRDRDLAGLAAVGFFWIQIGGSSLTPESLSFFETANEGRTYRLKEFASNLLIRSRTDY